MKEKYFLLTKEGKKYSNEEIKFHEDLIDLMFEKNKELKERYKKIGKSSKYVFLLEEGYLAGTDCSRYKEIVYIPSKASERIKAILAYYYDEGYKLIDASKEYGIEER